MKNRFVFLALTALLFTGPICVGTAFGVENAPRISDREIIERLTRLEEGQRSIQKGMEERFTAMEKRMDQRFVAMEKRMDLMGDQTGQQISSLEKRVDDRLDAQWNLTLILIAAIFGLIGFVVWDRKTAIKPLERRFTRIADTIERDLEPESPKGSRFARLMNVLRELAPDDPRLADALRRHSLLEDLPRRPA
uniref:Uncharacterized protein n=1 Tax=Candidatus Kentrum sp. FM TaxID=2126340 RepID=A0A450WH06_9GAMM|nr:MAG: hypothetical protein BECKFM1743B_GA0114221_104122 [Candidatus Kentron sp. FM]